MLRNVNTAINERIKQILSEVFNGNVSAMSKATSINRNTLNSIIGGKEVTPGYDVLRRIVELPTPQIDIDWLLTGNGEMYVSDEKPEISYSEGVPYYDEDFVLGFNEIGFPFSENPTFLVNMPKYRNATLWCNVTGDSMQPEIWSGDVVALQLIEDHSFLLYGDVYAFVTTNGLRTIKRLGKSPEKDCYRLVPTNTDYDAQDLPRRMILRVFRVLGSLHSF